MIGGFCLAPDAKQSSENINAPILQSPTPSSTTSTNITKSPVGANTDKAKASTKRKPPDPEVLLHFQRLQTVADSHLVSVVCKLCQVEALDKKWTDLILNFARRVCSNLKPSVRKGDKMNIHNYVKVYS